MNFSTPLNEIKLFEKHNPGVSVNDLMYMQKDFQQPQKSPTNELYPLKSIDKGNPDHFEVL